MRGTVPDGPVLNPIWGDVINICPVHCRWLCTLHSSSAKCMGWSLLRLLTGKETEVQRDEALSFPGLFGLLIFPVLFYYGCCSNRWGSLRLFTLRMTAVSQTRKFQNSLNAVRACESETLEGKIRTEGLRS